MGDTEIQNQRHRTHRNHDETIQLDVPGTPHHWPHSHPFHWCEMLKNTVPDVKTRFVTLSIVYYWLKNAIRFLWENIRSWCVICVCLQREIELGVTQELVLQSRALHKSDISGESYVTCHRSLRSWIPLRFWQWWVTVTFRWHPLPWL